MFEYAVSKISMYEYGVLSVVIRCICRCCILIDVTLTASCQESSALSNSPWYDRSRMLQSLICRRFYAVTQHTVCAKARPILDLELDERATPIGRTSENRDPLPHG